jgi:hypothetical protein
MKERDCLRNLEVNERTVLKQFIKEKMREDKNWIQPS